MNRARNLMLLCVGIVFLMGVTYLARVVNKSADTEVTTGRQYYNNTVPPPRADDRYRWKTDSPITVVNYFSIDCPHCRELFALESKREIFYKNTFSLIYRHSPLPTIQPLSGEKAVIAECVREQSSDAQMFNFIRSVFESYPESQDNNDWVKSIASKFVKNQEKLGECVKGEGVKTVDRERIDALSHEVYGTPTIVVFQDEKPILRLDKTSAQIAIRIMDTLRR